MTETKVFEILAKEIERISVQKDKPIRVAINGIEGTGKTVFTNKFSQFLKAKGKNALHLSIDGFHFNKSHRYQKGRDSAEGYYKDSYDEQSFTDKVLLSSQENPPKITRATHDLETDEYLMLSPIEIVNDTILITDGAYLFKPIYRMHWDLKVYLKTDFKTAFYRGIKRDADFLGGIEIAKKKFSNRYHQASQMYIAENNPEAQADIVIDNTDFEDLKIRKM